uniref:Uncharacterized protein n=1 Tax=Romanomermis culicivorax TaxID=13658 RepID=A0A915HJX6_ROMCU
MIKKKYSFRKLAANLNALYRLVPKSLRLKKSLLALKSDYLGRGQTPNREDEDLSLSLVVENPLQSTNSASAPEIFPRVNSSRTEILSLNLSLDGRLLLSDIYSHKESEIAITELRKCGESHFFIEVEFSYCDEH